MIRKWMRFQVLRNQLAALKQQNADQLDAVAAFHETSRDRHRRLLKLCTGDARGDGSTRVL
jgi:hypothetical protein